MVKAVTIAWRVSPTVKAVPLLTPVGRAEVLPTSRKLGPVLFALRHSRGRVSRECLGRGYDLIHQAALAPFSVLESCS
jgi:hypothetical protein